VYGEKYVGHLGSEASIVAPKTPTSLAGLPKYVLAASSIPEALFPKEIRFR